MADIVASTGSMIVVSNRLPFVLKRDPTTGDLERKASAGGLVTAVAPVVIQSHGLWVGWPGIHLEDNNEPIPESLPSDTTPTAGLKSEKVVAVHVDADLFDSYYNGCCNGTLWPLFHSMPDRANFSSETWRAYVKVNQSFAEKTMEALIKLNNDTKVEDGSSQTSNSTQCPLVWIHDYHLTLAANWVRQSAEDANIKCKLGFFLHIPFPPWDIFRLIPWSDDILQGMLGCDVVGFHIDDYCVNFVDCCQRRLGCRVDRKNLLVEHGGRTVRVRALPIGIPFKRFVTLAENAPKVVKTNQMIILGVDRLDYTKGLVHRLKAFELLLERYPEHLEKVTLLQIAVPSRTDVKEYQDLKEEMDQMVGKINGRFTTPNWSPIRYIYGCVGQDQLAAFYRDAAVCLVTPLRDGMNLVAKEFVACQINQPPGVLIVSPFAGAGEMMHEALLCNPYELEEASEVIHRALKMPEDERTLRMNYLRRREKQNDVDQWLRRFLKAMGSTVEGLEDTMPTVMQPVTLDDFNDYLEKYVGNKHKLALLLDYDGTLAPLAHHPDLAVIPPETKNVLERLANFPDVYIAIISGRNVNNVKEMVGIEGITYAGNHGLEILHPDGSKFVHPMPVEYENKVKTLLKDLQDKVCKQGAWVENKGSLLTFHYRETPMNIRPAMVAEAKKMIKDAGFIAGQAHCAIEAKPPVEWNKGRASLYILRTQFGVDWSERIRIIYVGDDTTDEDAMQFTLLECNEESDKFNKRDETSVTSSTEELSLRINDSEEMDENSILPSKNTNQLDQSSNEMFNLDNTDSSAQPGVMETECDTTSSANSKKATDEGVEKDTQSEDLKSLLHDQGDLGLEPQQTGDTSNRVDGRADYTRPDSSLLHQALTNGATNQHDNMLQLPICQNELMHFASTMAGKLDATELPNSPQPEAPIDPMECRLALLDHIEHSQQLIDSRLSSFEAQVAALESEDPDFATDEADDYFPQTKQTVQMLLRDLLTMRRIASLN